MTMVAGLVSVDDNGKETFTPNDGTNLAKVYYVALLQPLTTIKKQQKPPVTPMTRNPDGSISQGGQVLVNADGSRNSFPWSDGSSHPIPEPPKPTTVTVVVTPDATTKQKMAEYANAFATIVPYLQANAVASITIPASSAGDGLQTSASAGNPTTHPSAPKTLTGSIT